MTIDAPPPEVVCDRGCTEPCDACSYDLEAASNWEPPEPPPLDFTPADPARLAALAADGRARELSDDEWAAEERAHEARAATEELGAHVVRMSDVAPEQVGWLWPGRLPFGKLIVVDGNPKEGKSTLTVDLAARISTGSPFPDGHCLDEPRNVVFMTAEDGLADTVRPRLDAAGADASRVVVLESVVVPDAEGNSRLLPPSLPRDLDVLEAVIVREQAAMVVIDVLAAYLGPTIDGHRDQDVRRALMPLARLAERTGAAIVALRHLTKSHGGNALYAGGGSIGIVGAARSVLLVAADPDDESRRVLAVTACNVAAPVPALGFRLVPDDNGAARVCWLGETTHKADDLVSVPDSPEERSERDEAADWLADLLSDGPMKATDVKRLGRQAGHAERTLDRARARAGVSTRREGFGPGSVFVWELHVDLHARQPESHRSHARQSPDPGGNGINGAEPGEDAIEGLPDQDPVIEQLKAKLGADVVDNDARR